MTPAAARLLFLSQHWSQTVISPTLLAVAVWSPSQLTLTAERVCLAAGSAAERCSSADHAVISSALLAVTV